MLPLAVPVLDTTALTVNAAPAVGLHFQQKETQKGGGAQKRFVSKSASKGIKGKRHSAHTQKMSALCCRIAPPNLPLQPTAPPPPFQNTPVAHVAGVNVMLLTEMLGARGV